MTFSSYTKSLVQAGSAWLARAKSSIVPARRLAQTCADKEAAAPAVCELPMGSTLDGVICGYRRRASFRTGRVRNSVDGRPVGLNPVATVFFSITTAVCLSEQA